MNIVLDTNVLVAGLLSPFGACGEIVLMVASGELTLSFDARILAEYDDVLRRPKFNLEGEKLTTLLDYVSQRGQTVAASPLAYSLPDPDDEIFLKTTLASQAACLVTGNQNHFPAELCHGIMIYSPREFLNFYKKQKKVRKHRSRRSTRTRKKPLAG
jgi:putative PIN family toxin of toxin-antitoxin system